VNARLHAITKQLIPLNAMQRFTISLDDGLAAQFDTLIAARGYDNRSEAVRDLIRNRMDHDQVDRPADADANAWCVATLSYVYDHHDRTVSDRVQSLQHDQHDLVVTSVHHHLDHDHCLETVVLRGLTQRVNALAQQLIALRGVRHGNVHLVPLQPLEATAGTPAADLHSHGHGHAAHAHFKPLS
jgi:CopG family nickel-responsive transcriptional regulator